MVSFVKLSKRAKITWVTLGTLVIALPTGLWTVNALTPSSVRQALPASASNVQEYYSDDGFHGDFVRCLQADMPQSEMPRFAAKLGLLQRYNAKRDAKLLLGFTTSDAISWWQLPTSLDGAYFECKPSSSSYSLAKYENGHVYFKAIAW